MANNLELMLEAERRGILPPEKSALLAEARNRGLIADSAPNPEGQSGTESFLRGLADPVTGLAQMAYESVPEGVQEAVTGADQWLYEKTGGILGKPTGFTEAIQKGEQEFQARRAAAGDTGIDWARMAGGVASTAPLAAVAPAAATATLPARAATGAAVGGGFGVSQPVFEGGDFWQQKAMQGGTGILGGAAMAPVAGGVARVLKPATDKAAKALMKEGVSLTPGQILGGAAQRVEEKLRSVPIMGDFITGAQKRSMQELNKAAYNRALKPIGESAKDVPVGKDGVALISSKLSNAYDELLPKMTFTADQKFSTGLNNVMGMANRLPDAQRNRFMNVMRDKVFNNITKEGKMSGKSYKKAIHAIRDKIDKGSKSTDPDDMDVVAALKEVRQLLNDGLKRTNPNKAQVEQLSRIDKGYANYKVLEKASAMQNTESGFTAAQLSAAVKASDKSASKSKFARNQALMQDLSGTAKEKLAQQIPNSYTTDRLLLGAGALGAGTYSPAIPIALGMGSLPYTRLGQKAMAGLLSSRPESFGLLADMVRRSSPALGTGVGQLLQPANQ